MPIQAYIVLFVLIALIIAFLFDVMRPGLILFSAATIFLATGIITAEEMIKGFSNAGLLIIVVLFLINEGIKESGLITSLTKAFLPRKKNAIPYLLPRIMVPVSLLSAFLNNLPVVINIAPILIKWSDMMNLSYKKFLIPLSYAAIFGGMCTLIGTSSNLVVHGLMIERGMQGFHLFEFGKLGLIISLFGFIYISVFGNLLLPGKKIKLQKKTEVKDYYYNLKLVEQSELKGICVSSNEIPGLAGLELQSIERNGKKLIPGKQDIVLQQNDDILMAGASDRLNYILKHKQVYLRGSEKLADQNPEELKQYEVVLSPRFPGLGLTVTDYNFYEHFNGVVLAIHRNGERITANLPNLRLKVGDNVVLLATQKFIESWGHSHMFYLVNHVQDLKPEKSKLKRWIAFLILAAMVGAIIINEIVSYSLGMRINIFLFVAIAAVLLVWLKILPQQTYTRNVSWDLIISIASAFAISKGMQNTGIANLMAHSCLGIVKSLGPLGVLATLYLITAVLTEIITNNAAVALVFPVAVAAAQTLHVNVNPFLVAIAIAGASSFMSANGYRANLVIKAIGNYSTKDFLRIGAPLQLIAFLLSITLIPYIWSF